MYIFFKIIQFTFMIIWLEGTEIRNVLINIALYQMELLTVTYLDDTPRVFPKKWHNKYSFIFSLLSMIVYWKYIKLSFYFVKLSKQYFVIYFYMKYHANIYLKDKRL